MRARDLYTGKRFKTDEYGPVWEARRIEEWDFDSRYIKVYPKGHNRPLLLAKTAAVLEVEER